MNDITIKIILPSEFKLLAFHRLDDYDALILVHFPGHPVTPFASYRLNALGHCYWGDYMYTDLSAADAHGRFEDRVTGRNGWPKRGEPHSSATS